MLTAFLKGQYTAMEMLVSKLIGLTEAFTWVKDGDRLTINFDVIGYCDAIHTKKGL